MSDDIIHDGIPGSVRSMSCDGAESSVPELIPAVPVPGVRGGASLSHRAVSMPRNPALHIFCQDYHAPAPAPLWVVMVRWWQAPELFIALSILPKFTLFKCFHETFNQSSPASF